MKCYEITITAAGRELKLQLQAFSWNDAYDRAEEIANDNYDLVENISVEEI